jgi:hypothetical protein
MPIRQSLGVAGSHLLIWQVFSLSFSIITFLSYLPLPWRPHHLQRLPLRSLQEISNVASQSNIP